MGVAMKGPNMWLMMNIAARLRMWMLVTHLGRREPVHGSLDGRKKGHRAYLSAPNTSRS